MGVECAPKAAEGCKVSDRVLRKLPMTTTKALNIIDNAASAELEDALETMSSDEIDQLEAECEPKAAEGCKVSDRVLSKLPMTTNKAMKIIDNAASSELENAISEMPSSEIDELEAECSPKASEGCDISARVLRKVPMTTSKANKIIDAAASADVEAEISKMSDSARAELRAEVAPKVHECQTSARILSKVENVESLKIIDNADSAQIEDLVTECKERDCKVSQRVLRKVEELMTIPDTSEVSCLA